MNNYLFTAEQATKFSKHGIDLTVYDENYPLANVVRVSVKKGHFEEFYDLKSTYIYYIIEGTGTFYLNDEAIQVKTTDLVVIPPNTRIYYLGSLEMLLTVSPAFNEENERHVRFIDEARSS